MSAEGRRLGWLALLRLPRGAGPGRRVLVERLGEPREWLAPGRGLPAGAAPGLAERIRRIDRHAVERDARWLHASGARLVAWTDADYPALLREIPDPPVAFFCLGTLPGRPLLAMVGSRRATYAGRASARALAAQLTRSGLGIVSGLALGIDAEAHRGALAAGGPTVAVLGSGLAAVYPRQHAALAAEIAARGAVVSEYPPDARPVPGHFPHRNRIISGLSLGVLVVEAARRSGSLITARLAGEQGREVFAVPGAIGNPMSRGCHRLLREGAVLVEGADDVLSELGSGWRAARVAPPRAGAGPPAAPASALARRVLDCVDFAPTALDAIVERSGLTADVVSSMLFSLELDGRVRAELGGAYLRPSDPVDAG